MSIQWWYEEIGDVVIYASGRGGCGIVFDGKAFMPVMEDRELTRTPHKPGESHEQWLQRMHAEEVTFRPDQDIMDVVNWFLDEVAFSDADRAEILATWKTETGQTE
jgi:hypothetical protein